MDLIWQILGAGFGVYIVSRLIFAAYFKSKQLYEDQRYGKKSQQRSG